MFSQPRQDGVITMESYMLLLLKIFSFSFFLSYFPLSLSQPDKEYRECRPSPCGKVGQIQYPFWSEESNRPRYCGRSSDFKLKCPQDGNHYPSIEIDSQTFIVTYIDQSAPKMTLLPTDFVYNNCSSHLTNNSVSIRPNIFHYDEPYVKNVTLFYDCPEGIDYLIEGFQFKCLPRTGSNPYSINYAFYSEDIANDPRFPYRGIKDCKNRIEVLVSNETYVNPQYQPLIIEEALGRGFGVVYEFDESCKKCWDSEGRCGSNDTSPFVCYCLDGHHPLNCSYTFHSSGKGGLATRNKRIVAGVTAVLVIGAVALLLLRSTVCCCEIKSWRKRIELCKTSNVDRNIEAFIRNHGSLGLTRYKFADVKKMTNSFKDKLGHGGYGTVYKGKLLNGHLVAVKLLKASKENGEDFINEVASISRTSHVNVVSLLGFCFEGKQKALVYEFMSNGSLDKFIHNIADKNGPCLTWEKLYKIAIGIARGLEYLHRGCNTRILHLDIKPHNILLDKSFCPKISDFGLAKLCPKKESIISFSEARGTIGYLAPEVWNRNIGGVSHKSDVYSYGMMLLDMVGGRNNMNVKTSCSTDQYFPDYIYDLLEHDNSLRCIGANHTGESDIAKRMTIVGLWCIQRFPSQRPTMSRVIEMFGRRLDLLEVPPKPVVSSPPRLELEYSTSTNTTT